MAEIRGLEMVDKGEDLRREDAPPSLGRGWEYHTLLKCSEGNKLEEYLCVVNGWVWTRCSLLESFNLYKQINTGKYLSKGQTN